jgi:hypothetical protein
MLTQRRYVLDGSRSCGNNPDIVLPPRNMLSVPSLSLVLLVVAVLVLARDPAGLASSSRPARAPSVADTLLFVDAPHDPGSCPDRGVYRCRTVTVNYNVLDKSIAAGPGSKITINPFDDAMFQAVLTFSEIQADVTPTRRSWAGRIPTHRFSSVGFTFRDQSLVGTVNCPSTYPRNYFAIRALPGDSGRHLVLDVDPREAPPH